MDALSPRSFFDHQTPAPDRKRTESIEKELSFPSQHRIMSTRTHQA